MYVYMFVICLFAFLSIPFSWLPNSLCHLHAGRFICPTTSFRPCHRTFLPGFHRFRECVFHVHARMLAYLFPFHSVKAQSYLCFTHVYELFRHSCTQTCILVCLCVYIFILFVIFSREIGHMYARVYVDACGLISFLFCR